MRLSSGRTRTSGSRAPGRVRCDPHPMDDPYWQNLIDYYEKTRAAAAAKKKYQRMGPYGPYGPAVMPRPGMR